MPQLRTERNAVQPGQHQVQNNQVEAVVRAALGRVKGRTIAAVVVPPTMNRLFATFASFILFFP
jgi:hypothetical protein